MNCIIIDDDPIILKQLSSFIYKSNLLTLKGTYSNPVKAFDIIHKSDIDIIFLDIEMPEMSGLEYLEGVKSDYSIIVISGDRKYALETFEYGVSDYLLKPIEYDRFIKSINRAIERRYSFEYESNKKRIFIKVKNEFLRIQFKDILFIDISDKMNVVVTKDNKYKVKSDFINIEKLALHSDFVKINDFCIINREKICNICNNKLIFDKNYNVKDIFVTQNIAKELLKSISNNDN